MLWSQKLGWWHIFDWTLPFHKHKKISFVHTHINTVHYAHQDGAPHTHAHKAALLLDGNGGETLDTPSSVSSTGVSLLLYCGCVLVWVCVDQWDVCVVLRANEETGEVRSRLKAEVSGLQAQLRREQLKSQALESNYDQKVSPRTRTPEGVVGNVCGCWCVLCLPGEGGGRTHQPVWRTHCQSPDGLTTLSFFFIIVCLIFMSL